MFRVLFVTSFKNEEKAEPVFAGNTIFWRSGWFTHIAPANRMSDLKRKPDGFEPMGAETC